MKKVWAIILIIFFSMNSAIITSYFYAKKSSIKKEMKNIIAQNIDKSELEKIVVNKADKNFQRVEDKEFRYKGKLYDIVKEVKQDDKVIFYCINDRKEEALIKDFSLFGNYQDIFNLNFSITKLLNYNFIPLFLKVIGNNIIFDKVNFGNSIFIRLYNSIILELNTPPPEC